MILEPVKPQVLAVRVIPKVDAQLASRFKLAPHHRAIGMITCTSDDALYASLDEGTKWAPVDVVYAKSFYAGANHASGPFSGEIIGIFAGAEEESVVTALRGTLEYLERKAWFYSADARNRLVFFPHVISSLGTYLSASAGVAPGTPMAYLIAPPIEAILGLDAALKAAEVEMKVFYPPPSETNFSGGLLVGSLDEVQAAARSFQEAVLDLASNPHRLTPDPKVEELARTFGKTAAKADPTLPYRLHESGLELHSKPDTHTHLFDNRSLVHKSHPVIRFRGKLDLLQAQVIDAAVEAGRAGWSDLASDLDDVLKYLRGLMSSEVTGRPVPELAIAGFTAEELHRISHHTTQFLNVGWVLPDATMGPALSRLNLLRAACRDVELAALDTFEGSDHLSAANRDALLHGFNRLSNALYVLVCKAVSRLKS